MDAPLLVYTEQGYGDAFLFARFLSTAARRVSSLTLACKPELADLLSGVEGVDKIVPYGGKNKGKIAKISLMDLPGVLGVGLDDVAPKIPYIVPACDQADKKLDSTKPRIGIVWAGNTKPEPLRACPLDQFVALARKHDLVLHSLLVGPQSGEITDDVSDVIVDTSPMIKNFNDTACLIEQMDLIITIDTAVAHLSGAMGKTAWILHPFRACGWVWMMGREDSLWYPTTRLFRQKAPHDWDGVFAEVDTALGAWMAGQ